MTTTVSTIRVLFPEFGDPNAYPDSAIKPWLDIYTQMVGADRWGDLQSMGIALAVCHHLAIGERARRQALAGGVPGMHVGVLNNKSVDKVSTGYDVQVATEKGAGFWNQTTYGTRYWHYVQIFGAGPVQANTPGYDPTGGVGSGAWPGPLWPIY